MRQKATKSTKTGDGPVVRSLRLLASVPLIRWAVLAMFVCLAWLLLAAVGCQSQGISRTMELIRPDGSTERSTWRMHNQSLSWAETKAIGGMLLGSEPVQLALGLMGGTGLLGAGGAWLATRARAANKIRAEADKAYDEALSRAKGAA
jgi:hypothetical protein